MRNAITRYPTSALLEDPISGIKRRSDENHLDITTPEPPNRLTTHSEAENP